MLVKEVKRDEGFITVVGLADGLQNQHWPFMEKQMLSLT